MAAPANKPQASTGTNSAISRIQQHSRNEALKDRPSAGIRVVPTETQVGKNESIARDGLSQFYGQLALQHRTCIHERVEFPILAARIDLGRQIRQELLIEIPASELRRKRFAVNAREFRTHAGIDHADGKFLRRYAPHRENWLQSGIFQLLLAVGPYIG